MIALLAQAQPQMPAVAPDVTISLILILVSAALTENILLTRFLGMCPFLSLSRELKSATGMGLAVIFTTTCTCVLNYWVYQYLLVPLKAYGVPAESLKLILFIVVIAAFVQLMEMLIERFSQRLYFAMGIFLPLITVNCAILGASLFMVNNVDARGYGVGQVAVYGFGAGVGWCIAISSMQRRSISISSASTRPSLATTSRAGSGSFSVMARSAFSTWAAANPAMLRRCWCSARSSLSRRWEIWGSNRSWLMVACSSLANPGRLAGWWMARKRS